MSKQGIVISYDRFRGYGFVLPDDGGNDIFVHRKQLPVDHRYLDQNDRIEYEVGDREGRPVAVNVKVIGRMIARQVGENNAVSQRSQASAEMPRHG